MSNAAKPLVELEPKYDFFVGIDSDGCVFDTMEIKQKECFCPNTIKHWQLQAVSKYAREAVEFVNLYSKWRGVNRWPALIKVFDLLRERPEVQARQATIPDAPGIRAFIAAEDYPNSNDGLRAYLEKHPAPDLEQGLNWSLAVNETVAEIVHGIPPFPYVRKSLEYLLDKADMIVVSQTPDEALQREWSEHKIDDYVRVIAGQEKGTKTEHLSLATGGKYEPDHMLMIGDAPGDLKAARANNALFFPINPGHEEESWQRFYEEAIGKFLALEYAGAYETELIEEFQRFMPETPPWQR